MYVLTPPDRHVNTRTILFDLLGLNYLPQTAHILFSPAPTIELRKRAELLQTLLEVKLLKPEKPGRSY